MTIPGALQGLQIVKPLGADRAVLVASDQSSGSRQLVVVERVTRASPVPAARTELLRRGRALKLLEHPKVTKVRDVFERDGDVVVVSNYVDGEWLASLMTMEPRPPPEVMIRLIVDVLEGLGALHDLRDERDQPIGFVHGGIAPDTILVADDGVAEIARTCRLPRPGTNERYVPPELWRGDMAAEPRCDIYAVGAILRDVLADAPAGAKWAEPLTEIAWRACAVEPEERWPSAAAMATTVRRIAGLRMANASAVADFVRRHFGPAIRARRVALESAEESVPPSSGEPISLAEVELVDPTSSSSSVATLPRSSIKKDVVKKDVPVARVSLVKRPLLALPADDLEPAKPSQPPHPPPPAKITQMGLAPPPAPLPAAAPKHGTSAAPPAAPHTSAPPKPASPRPPPVAPKLSSPPSVAPEIVSPAILVAPTILVNAATAPPPPPTIVPEEAADPTAEYRRRLPTFPTFEDTPPTKDKNGLVAMLVAGAMVITFGLGWWLGKSATPTEPVQAIPTLNPSSTAAPPISSAPASATAVPMEAPSEAPAASESASASPSTATSAPVPVATSSSGAATMTTTTALTSPTVTATPSATAPTSPTLAVGTLVAPPRPTTAPAQTAATTTPSATTLAPRPTVTATTSPPPRPTSTAGGYVPSEL